MGIGRCSRPHSRRRLWQAGRRTVWAPGCSNACDSERPWRFAAQSCQCCCICLHLHLLSRYRLHPTRNHPLNQFYTHLRRCASPGLEHSSSVHITVFLQCKSLNPRRTRSSLETASCPPRVAKPVTDWSESISAVLRSISIADS
jgi:hypothetical protein